MTAKYSIVADERRATLHVTMWGFFGMADVDSFTRDLRLALADLNTKPNDHRMLCDLRQMKIQAQDIVTAFGGIVGSADLRSRRLAIVAGKSLVRKQATRLIDREGASYFDTIEAAQFWLHEEDLDDSTLLRRSVGQLLAVRGFR